jgi:RsiW-degrading membrane proteinase PrsW (M82 family)
MEQPGKKLLLPRDVDQVPESDVMPFRSKKINMRKSPLLYLTVGLGVMVVVLFLVLDQVTSSMQAHDADRFVFFFKAFEMISIFLIVMVVDFGIHSYTQSDKPQAFIIPPFVFIYLFMNSFLWHYTYLAFEALTITLAHENDSTWPVRMYNAFVGPGLREEFVKSLPILFGAWLATHPERLPKFPAMLRRWMEVRSPLDGILVGCAVGGAFTWSETSGQYVTMAFKEGLQMSNGVWLAGVGNALMLMIPRTLGDLAGHSAYSGIFGYFIGLAALYPKSARRMILIGWGVSAALHGFWDSDFFTPLGMIIGAPLSATLFAFCLVKARQIEMVRFQRGLHTHGSIVVGMEPGGAGIGAWSPPHPVPEAAPVPRAIRFTLASDAGRTAVSSTESPDFAATFGARGAEVRAEVVTHPSDTTVLGLLNRGTHAWYAKLANNSIQQVDPGKKLKLVAGASIDFGGGLVARIVAG